MLLAETQAVPSQKKKKSHFDLCTLATLPLKTDVLGKKRFREVVQQG